MGGEIIYPIIEAVRWSAMIFAGLVAGYFLLALGLRRYKPHWLYAILRIIFFPVGAMFALPSLGYGLLMPFLLVSCITGEFEPPSDRYVMLGFILVIGGLFAAVWWAGFALFARLEKFSQPQARPMDA